MLSSNQNGLLIGAVVVALAGFVLIYLLFGSSPDAASPVAAPLLSTASDDARSSRSFRSVEQPKLERVETPVPDAVQKIKEVVRAPAEQPTVPAKGDSQIVREEFRRWTRLAKESGISVPDDFSLPPDYHSAFAAAYRAYEQNLRIVDAVRMPLVTSIVDWKKAHGYYEEFVNPESLTGDAAKTAKTAFRDARKATATDQSVTLSGDANLIRIIRVNPADDPALPPLYEAIGKARRDYIQSVYFLIGPLMR